MAASSSQQRPLRVQIGTFNFNLQGQTIPFPSLTPWLIPTLSESKSIYNATSMVEGRIPPDIYAVGFQELLPLHLGFSDASEAKEIREHTSREIRRSLRGFNALTRPDGMYPKGMGPEDYTILGEVHLVAISLYVLGRNQSEIPGRVKEVRTSTASAGMGNLLGNKGGVAVRIVLDSTPTSSLGSPESTEEVLVFTCAHLAAHDHNAPRRNQDYKTIVQRLAFSPADVKSLPMVVDPQGKMLPDAKRKSRMGADENVDQDELKKRYEASQGGGSGSKKPVALDNKTYSLYDAHHTFFFGDLNYRIQLDKKAEGGLTALDVRRKVGQGDFSYLAKHDQLTSHHSAGKTLQGLVESPLGKSGFGPTYKFKPVRGPLPSPSSGKEGKMEEEKSKVAMRGQSELSGKRVPGWTDRIFWASSSSTQGKKDAGPLHGVDVELYRSIMAYTVRILLVLQMTSEEIY